MLRKPNGQQLPNVSCKCRDRKTDMTKLSNFIVLLLAIGLSSCYSPYRQFADEEKPEEKNLVGSYKLDLSKADCISDADKEKNPQITLSADGTFSVANFPVFTEFEKYEMCNGKGKWNVEREESWRCWGIFINYNSLYNSQTGDSAKTFITNYFIYGKKDPFKIYVIISDPDLWYGMLFEKTK